MRYLLPSLCLLLILPACTSPDPATPPTATPQSPARANPTAEPTAAPDRITTELTTEAAPTATPSRTLHRTPELIGRVAPTLTPTVAPTSEPTAAPTADVVPQPTATAVPEPTFTPAPTPTTARTPTPTPQFPRLSMEPSPLLGDVDLASLFDEIIIKTERREAFSKVKEANVGFSALDDMKALREEFLAAETELDLWYALVKLSNARRDKHLRVIPVEGGLNEPEGRPCVSVPIRVLPEILDVQNPIFFVATVEAGVGSPQVGDVIEGVNGRSMEEHIDEAAPFIRHSTLPGLYWDVARYLPRRLSSFPLSFYSEHLRLDLKRPSGERYAVSLPYSDGCPYFSDVLRLAHPYAGFDRVMKRESFHLRIDRDREILVLIWLRFDPEHLIQDVVDLVEYAGDQQMLDWDMVIDVTYSGGGTWGAYVVQRLVDQPFRPTFNNVRLSDQGKNLIERYARWSPRTGQPEIEGLDLSYGWLIDWARTDAREAIDRGDEWTESVPLRLTHLPKDSDGILQPASVHFGGEKAIINAWTRGGSHMDQFVAMFVDNDLATFLGVPTGGFSNPYEGEEDLRFPGTSRPVARFMWTLGHTLRPNGEVLEGNPAQPDRYIPLTRENFLTHHRSLLDEAIAILGE